MKCKSFILCESFTCLYYSILQVQFDDSNNSIRCKCLHFERHGILCRHIFYMLRHRQVDTIPKEYILRRWTKEAVKIPSLQPMLNNNTEANNILSKIYSVVGQVVNEVGSNIEALGQFVQRIEDFYSEIQSTSASDSSKSKKDIIESLLGAKQPTDIRVHVPKNIRNKGCGTSKRYVGAKEEAIKKASKGLRLCRACGKRSNHDSRNCKEKQKIQEESEETE